MSMHETKKFLEKQQHIYEVSIGKRKLRIPRKSDGRIYNIAFLRRDQQQIVVVVLHNINEWLFAPIHKTLRMTVSGVAGSGKSTLIQTLVATVRTLFQRNDVVYLCAPTGSAAFAAGGGAIHRLFGIKVRNTTDHLSATQKQKLMQRFANTVLLIVDERSMVGSELLALMQIYSRLTIHNA